METTDPTLQHLPVALRNLQQGSIHGLDHTSDALTSQAHHGFDPSDPNAYQAYSSIGAGGVNGNSIQSNGVFNVQAHNTQPNGLQNDHGAGQMRTPMRQTANGGTYDTSQYHLFTPEQQLANHSIHNSISRLQQETSFLETPGQHGTETGGHFGEMKMIENPPDLEGWREKLFNVDEVITLTEDEFQTYFPHVDNVYSHRSTQKYKRKPFVSHYWDCRLKGRPPGTPKSNDPAKKKRKRTARERDLCDVKIKITEYFPGAGSLSAADFGPGVDPLPVDLASATNFFAADAPNTLGTGGNDTQAFGVLGPSTNLPIGHPGATGAKFYTIQRVNGNNAGKDDSVGGPHRHTLEESDRVKKNSVQRWLIKQAKENKKDQSQQQPQATNTTTTTTRPPSKRPIGLAVATAKRHSKESDLKLFGSMTCPFSQRIWIDLEIKGIPYQYIELEDGRKPDSLLEISPSGRVPALKHGNWGTYDSMVIMEYLEDLSIGHALLPLGDPQLRAHCRQWVDHINRRVLPSFYSLLCCNDPTQQPSLSTILQSHITQLVNCSHATGPFFLGPVISYVDVAFAPWIIRLSRVLKYYRGWPDPEVGCRWESWVEAVESDGRVRATLTDETVYRDQYKHFVENGSNMPSNGELRTVFAQFSAEGSIGPGSGLSRF